MHITESLCPAYQHALQRSHIHLCVCHTHTQARKDTDRLTYRHTHHHTRVHMLAHSDTQTIWCLRVYGQFMCGTIGTKLISPSLSLWRDFIYIKQPPPSLLSFSSLTSRCFYNDGVARVVLGFSILAFEVSESL